MAQKQNASATQPVKMDSRKFLGALNDSAQARVAFFEDRVASMGKHAGKDYRLVALHAKNLYFEDTEANAFFIAEHTRDKGGKISISNIRPVEIVEEEKQSLFEESCLRLVNAIEENDQKSMGSAFKRMQAQRFSGRVVPYSGVIKGRDGVVRRISISNGEALGEDVRSRLISTIVESLKDNVIVENGRVVSGSFSDGDEVKLPVTKWAARKLVARRMRDTASNAFWSEGFQKRVYNTARLVSEGKINDAVKQITPFLDENEEFTLLTRGQCQTLVENALASQAIFNDQLARDTATLFYRTNMRISRNKIIDEWRNIAKKAEHAVLAENVQILESANNFEAAYDKFLELIFEAFSNKQVAAQALAVALEDLKDKTPKIKESHDLTSKLDTLIARLQAKDFDDAAIYEAEDLIATIQEELAATDTLSNFDTMPGDDPMGAGPEPAVGGEGQPVININSPLIQVGGSSSAGDAAAGGEEALPEMGEEPAPEEGGSPEDELAAILGGGGGEEAAPPAGGGGNPFESKRKGKAINESRPNHYEMKDDADDDSAHGTDDRMEMELEEDTDPYAFDGKIAEGTTSMMEYGAPVITDRSDLQKVVQIMDKLAVEHKLQGPALESNLVNMAQAAIKAIGLRVPEGRMTKAIEECINLFNEEGDKPFPGAAPPFGSDDNDSDSDDGDSDSGSGKPWEDDDDEDVAEDQFKGPRIRGRGFRKTSLAPKELKNESIEWGEAQDDGIMGRVGDVTFIFDHGGDSDLKPVILSEDGSVELPIPEDLFDSAFASAGMMDGNGDEFQGWLCESLEQLRPISDTEDKALEEAMATITTTPEGGISVEVSDDVPVDELGGEGDEMDAAGMEPVDSIEGGEELEPGAGGDGMMPDFEGGDEMGMEPGSDMDYEEGPGDEMGGEMGGDLGGQEMGMGGPEEGVPTDMGEEEEDMLEDKDVTEPQSSKYTKHVKENPRDMPAHKPTGKTDDKLEEVGPDLKQDDGSGTKPPTAKSMSNK